MFLLLCRNFDARDIGDGIVSQSIRRSCNRKLYEFLLYRIATRDFLDCKKMRQAIVLAPNKTNAMIWMMDAISGWESNLTAALILLFVITCITEDNYFVGDLNHSVLPVFVSAKNRIIEIFNSLIAINGILCHLSSVAWCIIGDGIVFVSNILHGACAVAFTVESLLLPLLFVTSTIELIRQPSALVLIRRGIEKMKTKAPFTCYLVIVICNSWNENQGGPVADDNRYKEASTQSIERSDYDTRGAIIGTIITFLLYFHAGWEFCMILAMPSKKGKEKKGANNVANNEGEEVYNYSTDFQNLVDTQPKLSLPTGKALEYNLPIEAVKELTEEERKAALSSRDNRAPSSRLFVNGAEKKHQQKSDPPVPPPGFFRMRRLKQRKEARLRREKADPPPGFYRMKELKRQKELAMRPQQKNVPPLGFESSPLSQAASNRRLKPNRKRCSKSRTRRPPHLEEIMNGEITDKIPEDFAVYLGSPSPKKRVRKFQEMFRDEQISTRVRKFLF